MDVIYGDNRFIFVKSLCILSFRPPNFVVMMIRHLYEYNYYIFKKW